MSWIFLWGSVKLEGESVAADSAESSLQVHHYKKKPFYVVIWQPPACDYTYSAEHFLAPYPPCLLQPPLNLSSVLSFIFSPWCLICPSALFVCSLRHSGGLDLSESEPALRRFVCKAEMSLGSELIWSNNTEATFTFEIEWASENVFVWSNLADTVCICCMWMQSRLLPFWCPRRDYGLAPPLQLCFIST